MKVGALLVGRIKNFQKTADMNLVKTGDEKGYFEFDGSKIIIILQKDRAVQNEKLYDRQNNNGEITVQKEFIASATTPPY